MGKPEKPELPYREDFYYPFEYNLENIETEFLRVLARSKFKQEDKERILRAYVIATKLHEGQTRKEAPDLPYVVHPLEVALEVMKLGGSPNVVIAALFHDVREDVKWLRELEKGEIAKLFRSRVAELLTRLLSKYRLEVFGFSWKLDDHLGSFLNKASLKLFSNFAKVRKLSLEEYFRKLEGDATAVFIKAIDRRKNLMSLGRMLDSIFEDRSATASEIIAFVRRQIQETNTFVIPLAKRTYIDLGNNLEELNLKLAIRLKIAENFLLQNPPS